VHRVFFHQKLKYLVLDYIDITCLILYLSLLSLINKARMDFDHTTKQGILILMSNAIDLIKYICYHYHSE